jgi:hypothetical protein
MLSLAPQPLQVSPRPATPPFFAHNRIVELGKNLNVLIIPVPGIRNSDALRWQYQNDFAYHLIGGYFVGPEKKTRKGQYGAVPRPTTLLIHDTSLIHEKESNHDGTSNQDTAANHNADQSKTLPQLNDQQRQQIKEDFSYWQVQLVVLPDPTKYPELVTLLQMITGQHGTQSDGAWYWDVRIS